MREARSIGLRASFVTLAIAAHGTALRAEEAPLPEKTESVAQEPAEEDPEAPARDRAQSLFLAGMEAFDGEKYAEALENFRKSHDAVKSPNSRLMAARSLRALGRMPEAFAEYDMTLLEAESAATGDEKYIETVQAARDELRDVRSQVALVMVVIEGEPPAEARLTVGGREIDRKVWKRSVPSAPGKVQVLLEGPGIERMEHTLDLDGGAEGEVEFEIVYTGAAGDAARERQQRGQLRTGAYIAGGVGGVGLLTFGILALAGGGDGLKYASLGVGAAGVVTGVVLYSLTLGGGDGSPPPAEAALVFGPGSLGVVGKF